MGQLQFQHLHTNRAGAIKRVVRRGGTFVCGLCRSSYKHEGMALGCLESCWVDVLALDPVIVKPRPASVVYRCRFCARDHAYRHSAKACAEDCRDRHQIHFSAERQMLEADDVVSRPRPKRRRGVLVRSMPAMRRPSFKKKVVDEPKILPVTTGAVAAEPAVAITAAPAAQPEVAADAAATKAKPEKVFYRDSAKYVCNVCHEKYFTKEEVTSCYEKH